MQEVYRIIVTPYNYDYWDIFTTDKELFETLAGFVEINDGHDHFGPDRWDAIVDSPSPSVPYVLLGEAQLRQYD